MRLGLILFTTDSVVRGVKLWKISNRVVTAKRWFRQVLKPVPDVGCDIQQVHLSITVLLG